MTMVGRLLCIFGRHDWAVVTAHWYVRPFGRCRRCGRVAVAA